MLPVSSCLSRRSTDWAREVPNTVIQAPSLLADWRVSIRGQNPGCRGWASFSLELLGACHNHGGLRLPDHLLSKYAACPGRLLTSRWPLPRHNQEPRLTCRGAVPWECAKPPCAVVASKDGKPTWLRRGHSYFCSVFY